MAMSPIDPEKDRMSRAYLAALLTASRENCTCGACKILRKFSEDLTKEFATL